VAVGGYGDLSMSERLLEIVSPPPAETQLNLMYFQLLRLIKTEIDQLEGARKQERFLGGIWSSKAGR